MRDIMSSMSQGRVGPLFDAMAEDVTWRWMGVSQWSRTFEGKQLVVDTLFGGAAVESDGDAVCGGVDVSAGVEESALHGVGCGGGVAR
ncbi:MAG: uncharacterized protein QOE61_5822 [Micromonosporaceae bacterium]|jgi:hypothetical protein|nr:uncharacterized protein [Micromonosporaceae bacterium]